MPATPEELSAIDEIVRLASAGDEAALRALVSGSAKCETVNSGPGGGPVCAPGEPEGTLVDSIDVGGCDGSLARLTDVQLLPAGPVTLVAAYQSITADGSTIDQVAFRGSKGQFYFDLASGGIVGVHDKCATAPPLVVGRNVKQWLIPPEYTIFAGEGTFQHVLDEPGAPAPFLWQFPVGQPGPGYRVYWQSAMVLACGATSCGEQALDDNEAARRLSALPAGSTLCVRGWRDDVGNIEARLLTPGLVDAPCEYYPPTVGVKIIDDTIRAALSQDAAALQDLIAYHTEGCIVGAQLSTPPECPPGQPPGTPVEVFTFVFCDGGPIPRSEVSNQLFRIFEDSPVELYAVVRPKKPLGGEEYRLLFYRTRDRSPLWLNLTQTGVVSLWGGCGPESTLQPDPKDDYLVGPLFKRG